MMIGSMRPFDIVLVPFPFSDLTPVKQRPCLVLAVLLPGGMPAHYIVAMVTSHLSGVRFPFDHEISDWKEAGLPKPSLVRPSKLVTIEGTIVRRSLGSLTRRDRKEVSRLLTELFSEVLP